LQDRVDLAEELSRLLPRRVHVLATSLRIRLFVRQVRFWDALEEIEKVLNEDVSCLHVHTKICKSVMDEFYSAISSRDDAVDEAKRFFTLQKLLSKYNRRTTRSLSELLLSDMALPVAKGFMEDIKIEEKLLDRIVEHVPEVLTDDRL
uniref:PCI domain-containing protein n=1 Tax=Gongylonema pulchrum TaxID=637853 RepID=A0A183ELH9_9BILA